MPLRERRNEAKEWKEYLHAGHFNKKNYNKKERKNSFVVVHFSQSLSLSLSLLPYASHSPFVQVYGACTTPVITFENYPFSCCIFMVILLKHDSPFTLVLFPNRSAVLIYSFSDHGLALMLFGLNGCQTNWPNYKNYW